MRLRELVEASVTVGAEASLADALQTTVEVAARLVSARYAALGILDRTGSHLERLVTTGIDDATRTRIGDLPSDHGILRVLLRDARPVRVADVTKERQFFGFPPGHPMMRSFLGVPIFVRGVVYGDLYLAEKEGGEFTDEDEELATLLATQTGITIEKMRIHEGAVHWIRQLEALDALTQSVLEERDVSRLLSLIARHLRELIDARRVLISLPASSGGLRVAVADGEDVEGLIGYDIPADSKHARVFARARSERIDSILEDPETNQVMARRVGSMAAILVPLVFHGDAIGVVSAFNKDGADPRFTDHDLRLAEAFGARAALAVHLSERVARETVDAILAAQEGERSRIARELHDTLLQGFISASMQLHVVRDQLPADSPDAPRLNRVLELMGRVIEEGRNAVRGLRVPGGDPDDLEAAFSRIAQELNVEDKVRFRVIGEGHARPLRAEIRDEVYRVVREAVVNAFHHARAGVIEVEVEFAPRLVRILVRDDGVGIDPEVLESGREGHWGLTGMRERAERIGGTLRVWSRAGAGTEVELSVPARIAFGEN